MKFRDILETKDEYKLNLSKIKRKTKDLDVEKDREKILKIIDININDKEMKAKITDDLGLNESPVGKPGRTGIADAQAHISDELVKEFQAIIKKLGGKAVATQLMNGFKPTPKPEINDQSAEVIVSEGSDYYDEIISAMDKGDSKFDQMLWDELEKMTADSGVYAGDATPDELLDLLSDKQLKDLYNKLSKKYKNLFEAEIPKSMKDVEKEYNKIKKDLDDLWNSIGRDMNTREVDVKISNEVLSNLNDGIMAVDRGFFKYMSKAR